MPAEISSEKLDAIAQTAAAAAMAHMEDDDDKLFAELEDERGDPDLTNIREKRMAQLRKQCVRLIRDDFIIRFIYYLALLLSVSVCLKND